MPFDDAGSRRDPTFRLRRSVEVLDDVIARELPFDLDRWFLDDARWNDCGTAACWAGWCARDAVLREEGLTVTTFIDRLIPSFAGNRGYQALADFFSITDWAAHYLASPLSYEDSFNPRAVRERVLKVLRLGGRAPIEPEIDSTFAPVDLAVAR